MHRAHAGRRGFTLVEVGVAMFIIVLVALAGFAYYGTARMAEINAWHDQNALFLTEREIEAWQANGYTGINGFTPAECTVVGSVDANPASYTFLPYGYRAGAADAAWTSGRKDVVLDGFTYRVRAANLYTVNTGNDCYIERVTAGVTYRYRRLHVIVQWGGLTATTSTFEMRQETRMAR